MARSRATTSPGDLSSESDVNVSPFRTRFEGEHLVCFEILDDIAE